MGSMGISSPVNAIAWDAPWMAQGLQPASDDLFPNVTYVYALDVYNETQSSAEGEITATAVSDGATICTACAETAPLVAGVAAFTRLGLHAMPGNTSSIIFTGSGKDLATGIASPAMPVTMGRCLAGQYLDRQNRKCMACREGFFATLANAQAGHACVPCALGYKQPATGQSTCTPCPAGYFIGSEGQAECMPCAPGTSAPGEGSSECTACAAGTSQYASGQAACVDCRDGTISSGGARECSACPAGMYSSSTTVCTPCPVGHRGPSDGMSACLACQPGFYQPDLGQRNCMRCRAPTGAASDAGEFSLHAATRCMRCAPGANCARNAAFEAQGESPVGIFHGISKGWWAYKNPRDGWGVLTKLDARHHSDSFEKVGELPAETAAEVAQREALTNPPLFHECTPSGTGLPSTRCLGGWNSTCADGYRGPLCAICDPSWYRSGRACKKCPEGGAIASEEYDAETHEVKVQMHMGLASSAALVEAVLMLLIFFCTKDPKRTKSSKGKPKLDDRPSAPPSPPGSDDEDSDTKEGKLDARISTDLTAVGIEIAELPPRSPPPSPPPGGVKPLNTSTATAASQPMGETTARILKDLKELGVSDGSMSVGDALVQLIKSSSEKIKILITHFTITSSFKANLDIRWPSNWKIDLLEDALGFINFDLSEMLKLECVSRINFFDRLFVLVYTSTAIILTVPLCGFAILSLHWLYLKIKGFKRRPTDRRRRSAFKDVVWNIFLFLCFFCFAPVSKLIFQMLNTCKEVAPEGGRFLLVDLSIRCGTSEYTKWVGFATISMFVYTVGIPLLFFIILYSNQRKLLLQTPGCQKKYGFLYSKYTDRSWYWELCEMLRKLVFTSLIMFVAPGTSTQVVLLMVIGFGCLVLHLHVQAYKQQPDAILQTVSMICIFGTLWLGLIVKEDVHVDAGLEGNPCSGDDCQGPYEWIYMFLSGALSSVPFILGFGAFLYKAIAIMLAFAHAKGKCLWLKEPSFFAKKSIAHLFSTAFELAIALAMRRGETAPDETVLITTLREAASKARAGTPEVGKDSRRAEYLVAVRIAAESIVLRDRPYGKGFLINLVAQSETGPVLGGLLEPGRPPFMFVKAWKLSHEAGSGMVVVRYDMRDVGYLLERDAVVTFPDNANKKLLVWDAKRAESGPGNVGSAAGALASAAMLKKRLGASFEPAPPTAPPAAAAPEASSMQAPTGEKHRRKKHKKKDHSDSPEPWAGPDANDPLAA